MKKKVNTHLSRMGFEDKELTTPKHDEMCLYFHNNAIQIIKDCFPELLDFKLEEMWKCKNCGYLHYPNKPTNYYLDWQNIRLACCGKKVDLKKQSSYCPHKTRTNGGKRQ